MRGGGIWDAGGGETAFRVQVIKPDTQNTRTRHAVVIVVLVLVAILCFWLQRRRKQGLIKNSIELTQRLRVALESAQGLEYLHEGCSPPIIHRDVKTANILLNARLEAKIADFGLSKAYSCEDDTHVSTNTFVYTPGYVDPEYQRTMQPSTKSDVYSFGVVLLQLVTGKPAIMRNPEPVTIINWARQRLARGDIEGVVDARMQGDHDINAVWKTTEIALKCTEQSPLQRPSMSDLVMQLQECIDLEEGCTGGSGIGGMNTNIDYNATTNQSTDVSRRITTLR